MSFNVYQRVTGNAPRFRWGTYGVEVEAERLVPAEATRLAAGDVFSDPVLRTMTETYWRAITDGSLRHNGVEFITPPLPLDGCVAGLDQLYGAMRAGLFRPSVRTGIHIHVNASTMSNEQMLEFMRAYVVLEPLLFRVVGEEREQNIYCVPLYRGSNEQRLWRRLAALLHKPSPVRMDLIQMMGTFRSFCKYSAINFESFTRLGTFEFRHAPTFSVVGDAQRWLSLVHTVAHFALPQNATLDDLQGVRGWAASLVPGFSWEAYAAEVESRGLLDFANSLQPFTYKAAEWGKPAGLTFGQRPAASAPTQPQLRVRDLELRWAHPPDGFAVTNEEAEAAIEQTLADMINEIESDDREVL